MEVSNSFNEAAAPADSADVASSESSAPEVSAEATATSSAGLTDTYNSAAADQLSQSTTTDAPPPSEPEPAVETEPAVEDEAIPPDVQAANEAQDRRIEEQGRISDDRYDRKQKFEEDLARRYYDSTEMLRTDISDLEDVLNNSGPMRLAWLKFTNQVPKDAENELKGLKSSLASEERRELEERQAFEAGIREESLQAQEQANEASATASPQSRRSQFNMSREQAQDRLSFLEANRTSPENEAHLRPGGKAEQFVHSDVAAQQEGEISLLKSFLKPGSAPDHDPAYDPEATPDREFNDGFEPSF